jgi:tetratricopeptide (TPR) repeat protein
MMMDFDLAESLFIESLGLARELDDRIQLAFCLVNLGAVHNERGRHEEARGLLEEALSIRRILDDRWGSSHVLHALGHTAFLSGDPIRSMSLEKQALAIQQEFHDYAESVRTIQDLALACAQTGAFRQAAVLFGALQTQREALKVSIWRSDQEKYDRCLPKIRESLGDEGYEAAYADGQVLTWDQAMTYALGV